MREPFRPEEVLDRRLELLRLKDEMDKISDELRDSIKCLGVDVISARSNPAIQRVRDRLCRLHMKAMVSCAYDSVNHEAIATICKELSQPRACIMALQLAEEQSCCARFLRAVA